MRYVLELSGEHPTLPEAEARAVLAPSRVHRDDRVLLADAAKEAPAHRLALSHVVGRHLASGDTLEEVISQAEGWDAVGSPFAVRVNVLTGSWDREAILDRVGAALGKGRTVDLEDPRYVVRVVGARRLHVHLLLHDVDRTAMDRRRSTRRPFFRPTSLHPRIARALVNLARPGRRVLDPFSGTGGIVLEAALMGLSATGVDVDPAVVAGARENADHFEADVDLLVGDVRDLPVRAGIDAVVTDPPYGRSTGTGGAMLDELREALFDGAGLLLSPGRRLVVVQTGPREAPPGWELLSRHGIRVHRSLTRHVHVLEKK